jgi:hypothetical protein
MDMPLLYRPFMDSLFLSYIDYELVDVIRQPQASEHFSGAG